jgi:hypothetical protein
MPGYSYPARHLGRASLKPNWSHLHQTFRYTRKQGDLIFLLLSPSVARTPHSYQSVRWPRLLKRCANVEVEFWVRLKSSFAISSFLNIPRYDGLGHNGQTLAVCDCEFYGRGLTKETGNRNATAQLRELLSDPVEHVQLN